LQDKHFYFLYLSSLLFAAADFLSGPSNEISSYNNNENKNLIFLYKYAKHFIVMCVK